MRGECPAHDALSERHLGRHDLHIAEATPYPLPAGSQLLQDLGFLAFTLPQVEILMPTKKPRGQELTLDSNWPTRPCTIADCASSMSTVA